MFAYILHFYNSTHKYVCAIKSQIHSNTYVCAVFIQLAVRDYVGIKTQISYCKKASAAVACSQLTVYQVVYEDNLLSFPVLDDNSVSFTVC